MLVAPHDSKSQAVYCSPPAEPPRGRSVLRNISFVSGLVRKHAIKVNVVPPRSCKRSSQQVWKQLTRGTSISNSSKLLLFILIFVALIFTMKAVKECQRGLFRQFVAVVLDASAPVTSLRSHCMLTQFTSCALSGSADRYFAFGKPCAQYFNGYLVYVCLTRHQLRQVLLAGTSSDRYFASTLCWYFPAGT